MDEKKQKDADGDDHAYEEQAADDPSENEDMDVVFRSDILQLGSILSKKRTSDVQSPDIEEDSPNVAIPICVLPPRPRSSPTKQFQEVNVPRWQFSRVHYPIQEAQRWLTLVGKDNKVHRYPLPTILPKVVQTRIVSPKHLPKDVEVDRRRRQFARINLEEELEKADITMAELLPTEEQYRLLSSHAFEHKFPLSFFDNTDFTIYSPKAWLALGVVDAINYPIPVRAFLPVDKSIIRYKWVLAEVSAYNAETMMWTVSSLVDDETYLVPNIQFMFLAENPHMFIKRLKSAIAERHKGEMLMQMELVVDCVLLEDIETSVTYTFKPIEKMLAASTASPHCLKRLRMEVNLIFERLMALFELEKFIFMMPKEFPEFRNIELKNYLPVAMHLAFGAQERKILKALGLSIKGKSYELLQATLFYCAGAIEAMEGVAAECRYIETLSIFVVNFAKPLPLSDFLQAQEHHSDNIANYLKVHWPQQIVTVICVVMRILGKGWLDINLGNWTVYMMCKISRFVLQVKYRMQESMQVLLESSLLNFANLVCDPCKQFLHLKPDYKWHSNFIETEFPFPKPVFSLIIGIGDDHKVFYSTTPEDYKPSLLDIFKRALEKTAGVRCVDADIMSNLRFAPDLYILTVELIEELYIQHDVLIERSYSLAVLPLYAYAKLFERYIPFYTLDLKKHMLEYAAAHKPSSEVKADIIEHKRQKEELREILPAFITIGPFQVNVDNLKQFLIKKRIEVVRRIFEYYVDRMYETNDGIVERCLDVFNRIHERPISIEHLYEIRDFALTVPDVVEQLKGDIQIMWLEYDLLDSFFYNLSDHQFAMKWNAYAWPHMIMVRLSTLKDEQKLDIEEFMRQHASECTGFEERLESLNDEVQAFSLMFNPDRAIETSVEVKKTWKLITELEKLANTLQHRQMLFELEPLSLTFLESIINSFLPYQQLWYACSNFIKLEEATLGNPLSQIDLDDVWKNLLQMRNELVECVQIFNEKPEIVHVAEVYIGKMDEFVPIYDSIVQLRNENWMYVHWQELSQRAGIEIKYTVSMNYQYLIRKGLLDFLADVAELSNKANLEAEDLRREMEEEERRKQLEAEALLLRKQLRKCRRDIL